jgi:GTPase SAR1 family protein
MYYRGAAAAIIVYDIQSQSSFARAKSWVRKTLNRNPESLILNPKPYNLRPIPYTLNPEPQTPNANP